MGGIWGWDRDLGFRFSSLLALCTPAKVHSLLGPTFLIYKMGVMNVLLTLLDRRGFESCSGYSITLTRCRGARDSGEGPGANSNSEWRDDGPHRTGGKRDSVFLKHPGLTR